MGNEDNVIDGKENSDSGKKKEWSAGTWRRQRPTKMTEAIFG